MRFEIMVVGNGRLQGYAFTAALLWAVHLLILAPGSKGEPATQPGVDNDPEGAPYVAGELLVAYEPGTSEEAEETVVWHEGRLAQVVVVSGLDPRPVPEIPQLPCEGSLPHRL